MFIRIHNVPTLVEQVPYRCNGGLKLQGDPINDNGTEPPFYIVLSPLPAPSNHDFTPLYRLRISEPLYQHTIGISSPNNPSATIYPLNTLLSPLLPSSPLLSKRYLFSKAPEL